MAEERWAALESNPDVLSKFCRKMGVGEQFEVCRVTHVLFVNTLGLTLHGQFFISRLFRITEQSVKGQLARDNI